MSHNDPTVQGVYTAVLGKILSDAAAKDPAVQRFEQEFLKDKKPLDETTAGAEITKKLEDDVQKLEQQLANATDDAQRKALEHSITLNKGYLKQIKLTIDDVLKDVAAEHAAEADANPGMNIIAFRKVEPGDNKGPPEALKWLLKIPIIVGPGPGGGMTPGRSGCTLM